MTQKMNEIAIELLEFKEKGLVHRVNAKNVFGDLSNTVGMDRSYSKLKFPSLSSKSDRYIGLATPEEAKHDQEASKSRRAVQGKEWSLKVLHKEERSFKAWHREG